MTAIQIVDAGHEDCGIIAQMHGICFDDAWPADTFAGFLDAPGTFVLLARRDENFVGFIVVRTAVDEAEILSIGVNPSARGEGCATKLVMQAVDQMTRAGATRMFLEVAEGNAAALRLYRKFGFEAVGRRKGYYRNGAEDGLTMRIELPLNRLGIREELD